MNLKYKASQEILICSQGLALLLAHPLGPAPWVSTVFPYSLACPSSIKIALP